MSMGSVGKTSLQVLLLALAGMTSTPAAGLKVGPAGFIVRDVAPGRLYNIARDTGLRLTIFNDDATTRTYVLSVHRPSERGQWETGYLEIPDARWCWFESNEVTVGPNGQGYADLILKVPGDAKYYNQHWVATIGVTGKPGQGGIALAVDIRVQIETAPKSDIEGRPDGSIGFCPSLVRFNSALPGKLQRSKVVIYNNDNKAHEYTIAPLSLDEPAKAQKYLTQSFESPPSLDWLRFKRTVKIGPGQSETSSITLEVPKTTSTQGKKWEEILLVKPDEGLSGFIRIQME